MDDAAVGAQLPLWPQTEDPTAIDTVLCDVGGVIIVFDPAVSAEIEVRHGLQPGVLLHCALKSPEAKLATSGRLTARQWFRATANRVGDAAVSEWLGYHGQIVHEVVGLLKALKNQNVRVVLLSNATTRLWDDLAFHGLDGLADAVFCSADIGLAKPDPDSFRYASEHGGFRLEHAMYVDDTPSWVAAGVAVGLHGHQFRSAVDLRLDLNTRGLLP